VVACDLIDIWAGPPSFKTTTSSKKIHRGSELSERKSTIPTNSSLFHIDTPIGSIPYAFEAVKSALGSFAIQDSVKHFPSYPTRWQNQGQRSSYIMVAPSITHALTVEQIQLLDRGEKDGL
jgi:hypothetical protein